MDSTTKKLQHLFGMTLETLQAQLTLLAATNDSAEKLRLSEIIKNLGATQSSLADTLSAFIDGDLDDSDPFEDDFYDDNDKELNGLLDTKQISFEKSKKEKAKKNKNHSDKDNGENGPF